MHLAGAIHSDHFGRRPIDIHEYAQQICFRRLTQIETRLVHTASRASFLSLLYDVVPKEHAAAALKNLTDPPEKMVKVGSPFAARPKCRIQRHGDPDRPRKEQQQQHAGHDGGDEQLADVGLGQQPEDDQRHRWRDQHAEHARPCPHNPYAYRTQGVPVMRILVADRQAARAKKDWARSDELRRQIAELGWQVKDTPEGPQLDPIDPP